jgi:2'-5' RNA ligase
MAFAVVLFFDAATEATVRQVARSLVPAVISADPFVGELRPHLTLGVCEELDAAGFEPDFLAFAAATAATDFTFASVGVFPNGDAGVLFLAPIVTQALLRTHDEFHSRFSKYAVSRVGYYLPGGWVPHCSLALNLPRDRLAAVVDVSARTAGLPFRGRYESIGVIQYSPATDIYTAPLGGA